MSFPSNILGAKSPFSPGPRPSSAKRSITSNSFRKSSVSVRSTATAQVVLKSEFNVVERFGQALPVLITEALTFAERSTVVSARISSECGYAWLVCGRRLLIWQYKQTVPLVQPGTPRRTALTNQCYELQLPQSDLAHRAELVSVFHSPGNTFPSCIAVSPEGVVRYWPAIAHEGMSVEQQIDLQGQECDSLTSVEGLGCILATTTCTVVLVQNVEAPRPSLICHTLKMPSGWLGGLSKRMSSFIFGPITTDTTAETRLVRILGVPLSPNAWNIFVLAGHTLQKWKLSTQDVEEFVYAVDLQRMIKEGFFSKIWDNAVGDQNDLESWILDLQPDAGGVTFLAAAVNLLISPQIEYALITADTSQSPVQFTKFALVKMSGMYSVENPAESLSYRLLLASGAAYIYNHRCVTVIKGVENPDCLEFNAPQDFLLGGSICVNTPVFFSRNYGLVSVTPVDLECNATSLSIGSPLEMSLYETDIDNLTLYSFNPEELQAAYKDSLSQLKAAFIFHIKGRILERNETLENTFALGESYRPTLDGKLDRVVVGFSCELLDDIPANDPRWVNKPVGLGSSYAMEVGRQLKEKQQAHTMFVLFLRESKLWRHLGAVTLRGTAVRTAYALAENAEKIVAATALKARPYDDVVQPAIDAATDELDISTEHGLTHQNIFYSQLHIFQNVIIELVQRCDAAAHSDMNPGEVAELIKRTNEIILDVLQQTVSYRQSNVELFEPSAAPLQAEYLPWTAATGREGLMDSLISLQHLTYNYGAKATTDFNLQSTLYEQLVSLIDIILDGRKSHLNSIQGSPNESIMLKQFASDRKRLIYPLINDEQWDNAALLAEKYLDFECLVVICEKTNNESRLDTYMDRFKEQDFPNFVYNWFLQENKQGKLFKLCGRRDVSVANKNQDLRSFLSTQPTLSWVQNAFDKKFVEAANTLKKLADIETDSLTRQKTMFSLAKLASLANGDAPSCDELQRINARLDIISYQEEIPDYVLQQYGYDTLKPSVIPVKDLIHLYVCSEYRDATEVDFKKALDLLKFVDDDELARELSLTVWSNAVLRDSWDDVELDSPLEILQRKLIFKIVDLALVLGADSKTLLPPFSLLLNRSELIELQTNKSFEYLMRTLYEHVSRIMSID